jgi:hypothetical protein
MGLQRLPQDPCCTRVQGVDAAGVVEDDHACAQGVLVGLQARARRLELGVQIADARVPILIRMLLVLA